MILLAAAAIATILGFGLLIATNSKFGILLALFLIFTGGFGLYTMATTGQIEQSH